MSDIQSAYSKFIQQREAASLSRSLTVSSRQDSRVIERDGRKLINFGGNDYLGLTFHPQILNAMKAAVALGAGSNASRLVTGNLDIVDEIETKLAHFKGREAALIMSSGYQANSSILPALIDAKILGAEPIVIMDKLVHASIYAGCKAAGLQPKRFHHNDVKHLEQLLDAQVHKDQPIFIITESVFSMDGDIAPLMDISALAKKYGAFFICDEAHATGIYGPNGSGLAECADLVIGTFGKAFGVFGSYVACSNELKRYLVNKCSGFIYSTALPPMVLAGIHAALELMPELNYEREHLLNLSSRLRREVQALGFSTLSSTTHIVPIMLEDADITIQYEHAIREQGFYVPAMRSPTVPPHMSRLRITLSAAHQEEDVEKFIDVFGALTTKMAA